MTTVVTAQNTYAIFGREIRTAITLGLGFLCVSASYNGLRNLQGSLNDENGLGVISLSCLYATAILSSIYAPTLIAILGVKRTVMLAFIGHLIYVVSNFYASCYTLIPSSIILGAVTGPMWTSVGLYLTSCAFSYAERTSTEVYTSLSKVNGFFYTVFELSNIGGNLLSSEVLYQGTYNVTKSNRSFFCGAKDCPGEGADDIISESYIVYILFGAFLSCVVVGFGIVTLCLSPLETHHSVSRDEIRKSLGSWFRLVIKSDIKLLIPFQFYMAAEQVIASAEITKSFVSCPIGIQNVGYVMTAYGVCTTMSTLIFSRMAKYIRRYILFAAAGSLHGADVVDVSLGTNKPANHSHLSPSLALGCCRRNMENSKQCCIG